MECVLVPHAVWRGSTHYVRGYFHCVPLLRPEEREFSASPNKGSVRRQWLPSAGILTWPV